MQVLTRQFLLYFDLYCLAGNILAGQKHCMTELRFVWPVSDRPLLKNHFEHRLHDLLIYIKTQEDRYLQYGKA